MCVYGDSHGVSFFSESSNNELCSLNHIMITENHILVEYLTPPPKKKK